MMDEDSSMAAHQPWKTSYLLMSTSNKSVNASQNEKSRATLLLHLHRLLDFIGNLEPKYSLFISPRATKFSV